MRNFALPVAAALALAVAQPAASQETGTLKKIKDTGTITLGHRDSSIPFSYYDDQQRVVGYAMDICMRIVDAVKTELKMQKLDVKLNPVTSATRIPLMANGTIDLECGSTTNNLERQKQVAFTITHYVTANRYVAKKASNISKLADLKGKTVVSTSGTTNIKWLTEENQKQNLGMNIVAAKDHAEAFLMVDSGRAAAFFMDDILLYSLVANARNPGEWVIGSEAYTVEPYGIMLRREDPAFKKVVDGLEVPGLLADEPVCGHEVGDRERYLLLPLEVVGGRAALEIDGPVRHQRNARRRGDRIQLHLQIRHLEIGLHRVDDLSAEIHRVADGRLLVVEVREGDRSVAVPERDRARLLDLLERALLRVCRRCDQQSAQGGQANRDEASEIAHVSCLLRYELFSPTQLGKRPDISGTQPASKGPNIADSLSLCERGGRVREALARGRAAGRFT